MSNAKDLPVTLHDQRLLTCATLVRFSPQDFDMQKWKCGTAHCAVGLYADAQVGDMKLKAIAYVRDIPIGWSPICNVDGYRTSGWGAVEHEFNLKHADALYLFNPQNYVQELGYRTPTRQDVAERIEAFVAQRIAARETAHV